MTDVLFRYQSPSLSFDYIGSSEEFQRFVYSWESTVSTVGLAHAEFKPNVTQKLPPADLLLALWDVYSASPMMLHHRKRFHWGKMSMGACETHWLRLWHLIRPDGTLKMICDFGMMYGCPFCRMFGKKRVTGKCGLAVWGVPLSQSSRFFDHLSWISNHLPLCPFPDLKIE